jgi:DnaD/phage-associated family protein
MCIHLKLFDGGMFKKYGIITSRGIQKRFLPVARKRPNNGIINDYWLLDRLEKTEENAGLDLYTQNEDFTPPTKEIGEKNVYSIVKKSKEDIQDIVNNVVVVVDPPPPKKETTTAAGNKLIDYLSKYIQPKPNEEHVNSLFFWRGTFSDDIIMYAMELTAQEDDKKRNFKYLIGKLKGWKREGLFTLPEIHAKLQAWEERNDNKSVPQPPRKKSRYANYGSRKIDHAELERLAIEHAEKSIEGWDGGFKLC